MRKPGSGAKRAKAEPAVAEAPTPEAAPEAPTPEADEPPIVQALDAPSKWSGAVVAGGLMLVAGLSVFAIRGLRRRK
jgi:hypothetical protein